MSDSKVWLVTGCSAGLGSALAKTVLAHGHKLIASSRNPSKTPDLVQQITSQGGHWIALDTTAPDLEGTVARAEAIYGRLDVVVNNAGKWRFGLEDARRQMETNFWGPCRIMLAVLPGMRARKSGFIVNVTSAAGLRVLPTYSHYSSTKFALEAISEGIAQEVANFNIRIQLVEPGAFRTNFLGQDNIQYAPLSEPYKGTVCEEILGKLRAMDGKQAGNPVQAAQRIFEVVTGQGMAEGRKANLRLPLGSDCIQTVRAKLDRVRENFEQFEDIAVSTDGDA
ncbi:Short chain oxidoreductase/dehydrogenase, putative [Tolypocladium paradoxum]|uniref:Short chain oxidoreductase/dehydrogenase, putative n=1 Tax=Tolypocladium paradoxum TaxID=94208 RepID=A0A2S4KQP8_9HYPO|nr:Short chain oxidoreductase/dehydrogenase, putative [Tolypocladium paradoxum]